MEAQTAVPAAGWFPDPAGSGDERWWSGDAWTAQLRRTSPAAPPTPPASPARVATMLAEAPEPPETPQPPSDAQPEPSSAAPVAPAAEQQHPVAPTGGGFALPGTAPSGFVEAMARAEAARAEAAARAHSDVEVSASPYERRDSPEPAAPAMPAAASAVGFTTSADPEVAGRYRTASAEPEHAPTASDPSQPGWQGLPLPGDTPAAGGIGGVPVPAYAATAPAEAYGVDAGRAAGAVDGGNKTAWTAFGSGALAVGLSIFFLFFDRIGLWPTLLAVAAVVQGIIGIAHARRTGVGLGAAIGGVVLGPVAIIIMAGALITANLAPAWDHVAAEQDIIDKVHDWEIDLVSADCPIAPPLTTGSTFACTAIDGAGTNYTIDVTIDEGGSYSWVFNG